MMRKLSLSLALMVGAAASVSVDAHTPLLRGIPEDTEVEAYNFVEELEAGQCTPSYWIRVKCAGDNEWREKQKTNFKSKEEITAANVCGECNGKGCAWQWGGIGCAQRGAGIQCTIPHQHKVASEGHEAVCNNHGARHVPYECEDGTKMCCTESSMTEATFDKYGKCSKKGEVEVISDE
ncbi:hypothetical protein ACHAWF_001795 [Thalassiosira exigua]